VLNGAILMILVSCVIGPWAVERYGRRLALATNEPPEELPETLRLEQRIVAPVGNPATMRALLEFAFLLRNRDLPGMIYPLRIVPDGPGAERQVSMDEELLARCVAQAASADMAVSPLVRLDLNPVDGIVRATREVRATTLVMGWQGHRTPGSYIFGGIFDQVLAQCPQRVLVCRLCQPLNLTRRLTAIIPPYLESEADFATVLQRIKWLAQQTGSTLRLCYPAATDQRLPTLCGQTRPQLTVEYTALAEWPHDESLLKLLPACPRDELLVLVAARRDTPAWQPHLEHLPSLLAETYPEHNLIVIYPLSVQAEETAAAPPPAIAEALLPPLRTVLLECPAGSWEPAIQSLLAEAMPTDLERRAGTARQIAASANDFPVELQPGVVLLHAHCEEVDEMQLHVARSSGGLTLPGLTHPAHLLLVLLTPREHPPQQYLQALGALARLLRQPGMIEQVRQAPTIAAVHAHFLVAPPPG
jgi:mannitol/fructose-specific phosphotransferase system IIA component (Ntr-type)/nucleotide-binding universal stress UspA family protein